MLSLEFTMHCLSCSATTFASLFEPDHRGRSIPETSSFACVWACVPRAGHRELNPVHIEQEGSTRKSYFKASGSHMVLDFSGDTAAFCVMNSDVVMFQLRPLTYRLGSAPVLAKGTLDPVLYTDKPRLNYLISLRDASDQVLGTLSLSLKVEIGNDSNAMKSLMTHNQDDRHSLRLFGGNSPGLVDPNSSSHNRSHCSVSIGNSGGQLMAYTNGEEGVEPQNLELTLEHVILESDFTDSGRASPFVQKAEYCLKMEYDTITYTTSPVVCGASGEVDFLRQKIYVTLLPRGGEKLRFSLWENGRQVSGFLIDPTKLRVDAVRPMEYTVPFRYHPTNQGAALAFTIRKAVSVGAKATRGSLTSSGQAPQTDMDTPLFSRSRGDNVPESSSPGVLKRAVGSRVSRPGNSTSPKALWGTFENGTGRKVEVNSGIQQNAVASSALSSDVEDPKGRSRQGWRSAAVGAKRSAFASKGVAPQSMASAGSSRLNSVERGRGSPGLRGASGALSIDIENSMGQFPQGFRKRTPLRRELVKPDASEAATSELEAVLYDVVNRIEQRRICAAKRYGSSLSDDWRAWNAEMAGRRGSVQRLFSPLVSSRAHNSRAGSVRSRASSRTSASVARAPFANRPAGDPHEQGHSASSRYLNSMSRSRLSSIW